MLEIGIQTWNSVDNAAPEKGFRRLASCGFKHTDFSLHTYLKNSVLYQNKRNKFFSRTRSELEQYFTPHKKAAKSSGINIFQMHMPYPNYVPLGSDELNDYLRNVVAPRSMELCSFFDCRFIVVHGFKLAKYLGSEEAEWQMTEGFIRNIAGMAKEMGITICIENLYGGMAGHIVEGPCCNVSRCVERIDRLNDEYGAEVLGFCFDTGHANLVGLDFEKFITALDYRLKVLHIHDNDGMADLHQIPYAFTRDRTNSSSTDWEGFIQGLRNIKYHGVLNFETGPLLKAFPEYLREDILRLIAKTGSYFAERINGEDSREDLKCRVFRNWKSFILKCWNC